jgi:hypothetical protein
MVKPDSGSKGSIRVGATALMSLSQQGFLIIESFGKMNFRKYTAPFAWKIILWIQRLYGVPDNVSAHVDYQGYRKAVGGNWALWEIRRIKADPIKLWLWSECRHYPKPYSATHTEPLEVEEY